MGNRKEKAAELHANRHTCSQAVACAFCDLADVDAEEMKKIVLKYSGGRYKVCGAVMGAYTIVNYLNGNRNPENSAEWHENDEELLKEIEKRFIEKNGTVICRELKGLDTGKVLRPCRGCVEDAAEILEEILSENK